MITGIDLNQTIDYISKSDKAEPRTVWKIGVLPTPVLSYCTSKMTSENQSLDLMVDVVRFGLKGIENFQDKSKNSIGYAENPVHIGGRVYQSVSDRIINIIPMKIITELGNEILKLSHLTDDESKN